MKTVNRSINLLWFPVVKASTLWHFSGECESQQRDSYWSRCASCCEPTFLWFVCLFAGERFSEDPYWGRLMPRAASTSVNQDRSLCWALLHVMEASANSQGWRWSWCFFFPLQVISHRSDTLVFASAARDACVSREWTSKITRVPAVIAAGDLFDTSAGLWSLAIVLLPDKNLSSSPLQDSICPKQLTTGALGGEFQTGSQVMRLKFRVATHIRVSAEVFTHLWNYKCKTLCAEDALNRAEQAARCFSLAEN